MSLPVLKRWQNGWAVWWSKDVYPWMQPVVWAKTKAGAKDKYIKYADAPIDQEYWT